MNKGIVYVYNQRRVIRSSKLQLITMNNNPSSIVHCFSCGKQLSPSQMNNKLQKHNYPVCNQKSDSISLQKHYMCEVCVYAFESVKDFVKKHQLKWFNPDFHLQKIIDSTFIKMPHFESPFTKQNKRKSQIFSSTYTEQQSNQKNLSLEINLPNDIYSAVINDNIQSEELHHVYWLPKTLQYLIYLTSSSKMRPEERRERVKKTLQVLSYIYCVDESDLKYLAIIVQTLFCYMNEQALLKIMDSLLKGFLKNNVPMQLFLVQEVYEVEKEFGDKHSQKKPIQFRPDNLLYVIFSIFILFDFFKDGKLQRHISQIVHLSHQELVKKQQGHQSIDKVIQSYLKSIISDGSSKISKLSSSSWGQMIEIKRQKNQLSLIMKTIKKQQLQNQEIVKEMEGKFKKQKDQYINKIVKLNNYIETLEKQLKTIKENTHYMNSSRKSNRITTPKEQDEQVRSNPQLKIDQVKQLKNHPSTERPQTPQSQTKLADLNDIKKHKSQLQPQNQQFLHQHQQTQQTIIYLQSILQVTDIIAFNRKSLKKQKKQSLSLSLNQLPNTLRELSQVIITEVNTLQKKFSYLVKENKKLKEESTRLLAILKRKEESWLPLLHQKDEIISLYEKALICLQQGYVLPEQPLSSRIQAIVQKVSKVEFIKLSLQADEISMRDTSSVRTSFVEDFGDELIISPPQTEEKQPSSQKKKTPVKRQKEKKVRNSTGDKSEENKIKKKDKKQTECLIF